MITDLGTKFRGFTIYKWLGTLPQQSESRHFFRIFFYFRCLNIGKYTLWNCIDTLRYILHTYSMSIVRVWNGNLNVTKYYTTLQWALFRKNGNRKWCCFTLWLCSLRWFKQEWQNRKDNVLLPLSLDLVTFRAPLATEVVKAPGLREKIWCWQQYRTMWQNDVKAL